MVTGQTGLKNQQGTLAKPIAGGMLAYQEEEPGCSVFSERMKTS